MVTAAAAGLAFGTSVPVEAQDDPIRARAVVEAQILREILREVRPAIGPRVRDVIRDVVLDVRPAIGPLPLRPDARQNRQFRAEQIDRQTQTLQLGATGLLELGNVAGDISVSAGTGRDVTLEIVRTSRGRTDADAKLGLDQVRVVVERRGNERATVRASYPETTRQQRQQQPYSVTVTYTVTAPPGTRVAITTVSGDVVVKDIRGDVSAQVTSGDITITGARQVSAVRAISGDVTLRDSASDGSITAGTISGNVLFERVKAQRIGVDVTGGDIIMREITTENAQLKTLSGDVEFSGALSPKGRYELQSHSGDVQLSTIGGAGFELQAQTFSGSLPQTGVDFRNVSTARRSLRGTVGDGSAIVTITTFSGDVRLIRK